ncbi:MAG TPA: hypothetical protein VFW50_43400 [Streptosporangiaceae bacterium]|nr:hypothetical protein [Streptosporangiaceae bacterium]
MTTGRHRKGLVLESLTPPAAGSGQPGQPRQPPAKPRPWHRLEFTGLVIGLACGLVVALAALAIHGSPGPAPRTSGPVTIGAQPHAASGPDPAALDAQWTTYSDHATCADWAGGDGVSAVSLGSGQLAWFFADTYLGPAGPAIGFSDISGFVHNSVVVQTTTGQQSRFVTLTGGGACDASGRSTRAPSSVVGPPQAPGLGNERYWDEDGIKVGRTVVKFYNRYLPGSVPFVATGTVIAAYDAGRLAAAGRGPAYGAVATPRLIALPAYTPPDAGSPVVWGAALLRSGDTVYVYGTQTPLTAPAPGTPVAQRQLYLARVPASQLTSFGAWRFYAGSGQWTTVQQDAAPLQPAGGTPGLGAGLTASSGFSVVQAGGRYWLIQADPVAGSNDIDAYPAAAPWGPFDPAAGIVLYRNPDVGLDAAHDYRIMYEARAEPALSSPNALVVSYNVNSLAVTAGCVPLSAFTNRVTQPRFLVVPESIFRNGHGTATTRAGSSDYPSIVPQDPRQWFDEWKYPDGCPPVPAVTRVRAQPKSGAVTLGWPGAGLGLRYQVTVQGPSQKQVTVRADSATVSGLPAGTYLARVVPVNLKQQTGSSAQVSFVIP